MDLQGPASALNATNRSLAKSGHSLYQTRNQVFRQDFITKLRSVLLGHGSPHLEPIREERRPSAVAVGIFAEVRRRHRGIVFSIRDKRRGFREIRLGWKRSTSTG